MHYLYASWQRPYTVGRLILWIKALEILYYDNHENLIQLEKAEVNWEDVLGRWTDTTKKSTVITSWMTKQSIPIKGCFNCKAENAIYVLSCQKWGLHYVGQTGNTFNERLRGHLADNNKKWQWSEAGLLLPHIRFPQRQDVTATIVTTTAANVNIRLRTEEAWIPTLRTHQPLGLNIKQWR